MKGEAGILNVGAGEADGRGHVGDSAEQKAADRARWDKEAGHPTCKEGLQVAGDDARFKPMVFEECDARVTLYLHEDCAYFARPAENADGYVGHYVDALISTDGRLVGVQFWMTVAQLNERDAKLAAQCARIAELEAEVARLRALSEDRGHLLEGVIVDTAGELGCECDNEAILFAVAELKADNKRLKEALKPFGGLGRNTVEDYRRANDALAGRRGELESETQRLKDALTLAANRLNRLVLDQDDPRRRLEADDWTREARAALQPQGK